MLSRLIFMISLLISTSASAAVIFSACPVPETKSLANSPDHEIVDRFRPSDFRLQLRSYSQAFPRAVTYLRWLFSEEGTDRAKLHDLDDQFNAVGVWAEDMELLSVLSRENPDCRLGRQVNTQALAIFPFVRRFQNREGTTEYRVRYKVCEYYVDGERQLPFEDGCHVIGREAGYSFEELKARFNQLNVHIVETKEAVEAGILGAGLIAVLPTFKGVYYLTRALPFSRLLSLGVAGAPVGGALAAIHWDFGDEFVRNMIDFRDANEVALTGDLKTSVTVNLPMQEFLPYFMRYLDSLDGPKQKLDAPAADESRTEK